MGLPKKKKSRYQKSTLKQRLITISVIVIPLGIVIAWLVLTVIHNPAPN